MRTTEQMYPIIEQWKKSNLSKTMFCRRASIPLDTFCYWVGKYNKSKSCNSNIDNFIPLTLPIEQSMIYMEVTLRSGTHVKFYQPLSAKELTLVLTKC